jgi:prolycopene isomerase
LVIYNRCCELDRVWGTDAEVCPLQIRIPTLIDESLAPPGHSVVQILAFLPYDYQACWGREDDGKRGARYRGIKEEAADCLIGTVEKIIPELSQHIVCKDVATPLSFERYTLNSEGANGWLPLPGDGLRSQRTPIRNLYQAGQWTYPGAGVPTVITSGKAAADIVLKEAGARPR